MICAGIVAAIGMNGLLWLRVIKARSSPAYALCFAVLFSGVVLGCMLPIMQLVIDQCYTRPPSLSLLRLPLPLQWIVDFLGASSFPPALGLPPRLATCFFWVVALSVGVPLSEHICRTHAWLIPHIACRKLFHFLSVAMFSPVVLADPDMMFLSFSVALCALVMVEYVR